MSRGGKKFVCFPSALLTHILTVLYYRLEVVVVVVVVEADTAGQIVSANEPTTTIS